MTCQKGGAWVSWASPCLLTLLTVLAALYGLGLHKPSPYLYPQISHSGAMGVRASAAKTLNEMLRDSSRDPYGQELVWASGQPQAFAQW